MLLFSEMTCSIERAKEYWDLIALIFTELEKILPFENLRNNKERSNFLICS